VLPPVGEITPPKEPNRINMPRKVNPSYENHNYEYGEESENDGTGAEKDPYMKAAAREFEAAKKAFETAQKSKEDALKKQEDRVK
jgi:hypothetical protein